ncbi:hypothetical protein [Streptomyces sp. NPDC056707]|uniref:hypothetical protein n=1 Tax=Streptomyces sp. NPDC056707 TaxID=3345919 RepID=UPI0036B278DD
MTSTGTAAAAPGDPKIWCDSDYTLCPEGTTQAGELGYTDTDTLPETPAMEPDWIVAPEPVKGDWGWSDEWQWQ